MTGRLRRDRRGDSDVATIIVVVPLALAVVLLFVLHRGIVTTLGACAALALAWHLAG